MATVGREAGTVFPEPITQAMSWNVSLVAAIAATIAAEASAIGVDTVFAPVVNMMPGVYLQPDAVADACSLVATWVG